MSDLDVDDVVASITNGDMDGDALLAIGEAIKARVDERHVAVRWWVHLDDRYYTAATANIAAAVFFEKETAWKWDRLNAEEVSQRYAIVLGELIKVDGKTRDEAVAYLSRFKADELTWGEVAVVNPPKDSATSEG